MYESADAVAARLFSPRQGPRASREQMALKDDMRMAPLETLACALSGVDLKLKSVPRIPMAAMGVLSRK